MTGNGRGGGKKIPSNITNPRKGCLPVRPSALLPSTALPTVFPGALGFPLFPTVSLSPTCLLRSPSCRPPALSFLCSFSSSSSLSPSAALGPRSSAHPADARPASLPPHRASTTTGCEWSPGPGSGPSPGGQRSCSTPRRAGPTCGSSTGAPATCARWSLWHTLAWVSQGRGEGGQRAADGTVGPETATRMVLRDAGRAARASSRHHGAETAVGTPAMGGSSAPRGT